MRYPLRGISGSVHPDEVRASPHFQMPRSAASIPTFPNAPAGCGHHHISKCPGGARAYSLGAMPPKPRITTTSAPRRGAGIPTFPNAPAGCGHPHTYLDAPKGQGHIAWGPCPQDRVSPQTSAPRRGAGIPTFPDTPEGQGESGPQDFKSARKLSLGIMAASAFSMSG